MKHIKLLTHARVNGVLRSPSDGVLHLDDEEAQRLLDAKSGEDVSDDFAVAETAETETKPAAAKAAAKKES